MGNLAMLQGLTNATVLGWAAYIVKPRAMNEVMHVFADQFGGLFVT